MGEGSSFRTLGRSVAQREAIGRAQLGGALRPHVPLAITTPLDVVLAVPAGVRRVALCSTESDAARLIALLGAAANALGPDVELALHLDAQLGPNALGPLRDLGRRLKLAYIADPCAEPG